jgi:DNA-binding Lrp family transcriptional regulator
MEVIHVKGFIMINVEPGTEKAVHDCLQGVKGIREVVPVYGEKDFIAILDVESIADLNRAVLNVRDISGVTYTQTILGMELMF